MCASATAVLPLAGARARPPARPPNNDYFSGPVHVARPQAWRDAHPGYSRSRVRPSRALQDTSSSYFVIAHVMVFKYCNHIPLYRQSSIYARDGVEIDRSTTAGWVDRSDQLLDPLVAALGRYTLAVAKVLADDTPVPVLSPGLGKTKTGRL